MTDCDSMLTIDLVQRAREGSGDAREELFARYGDRVLAIVRARLGRRLRANVESRDILQDALAEAVGGLERFEMRDDSSLIRWLATLVEHQITAKADYWGAAKRDPGREVAREGVDEEGGDLPLPADDPSPSMVVGASEEAETVIDCIRGLPERQRELILLRDYSGASWQEVADAVGAPSPGAARMLHARAVARLGKLLRERGLS